MERMAAIVWASSFLAAWVCLLRVRILALPTLSLQLASGERPRALSSFEYG
jgi:hypothetical protein